MTGKILVGRVALNNIKPYVPGKPIEEVERELGIKNIIKMASNENPLGPAPKAVEALSKSLHSINLYPDGACFFLRQDLATYNEVDVEQVLVGNGSDEIIKLLGEAYLDAGDNIIMADPSFSEYEFVATLMGAETIKVSSTKDFGHDLDGMLNAINEKTKIIFICNPNNPTGTYLNKEAILDFMAKVPKHIVVVFDEAYVEYVMAEDYYSGLNFVKEEYNNVIVLRTFSKIYGLSGLRVGYGIASKEFIAWLAKTKEPFNVNSLAQVGARAALLDKEHLAKSCQVNEEGKKYLYAEITDMGLEYVPTNTNFLWFNIKTDCVPVFKELLQKGVIIRTGDVFGFPEYIRVTIGTREQNERFIKTLKEVLNK